MIKFSYLFLILILIQKEVICEMKTDFFKIEKINGIWWFIDTEGKTFISKGVNHINFFGDYCPELGYSPYNLNVIKKYGNEEKWAIATVERLKSLNFNTIGAWSSQSLFPYLPYTYILNFAGKAGGDWLKGSFPDVFDPKFSKKIDEIASKECLQRKNDKLLIGYFTDNELRWGPDWRSKNHILDDYIILPSYVYGKNAVIEFFKKRYKNIDEFKKVWNFDIKEWDELKKVNSINSPLDEELEKRRNEDRFEFLEIISQNYFRICYEAIKKYDPNHLILGARFAGYILKPVLEGMKDYVDAVSFNWYGFDIPKEILQEIYSITGKPIIITEFSFKAMDSNLPNNKGAGQPLKSQNERAQFFEKYVNELMKLPYCIGYHWFQWSDQPEKGRFDGENNNYGIVNEKDEEWKILTDKMKKVNGYIDEIHKEAK
jgi:hypothetical protein